VDSGVTLQSVSQGSWQPKPKLLDRLREALRSRYYSRRSEQSHSRSVKRFIFFHNVRHPAEMAEAKINAFLTHLAVKEKMRRRAPIPLRASERGQIHLPRAGRLSRHPVRLVGQAEVD